MLGFDFDLKLCDWAISMDTPDVQRTPLSVSDRVGRFAVNDLVDSGSAETHRCSLSRTLVDKVCWITCTFDDLVTA